MSEQGLAMILKERRRQIEVEGYTIDHDGDKEVGDLVQAARCYRTCTSPNDTSPPATWPWREEDWKPRSRERNLVRAGALYLAASDLAIARGQDGATSLAAAQCVARELEAALAGAGVMRAASERA